MKDQKSWYMSRTIIASIVTVITLIVGGCNITIDTETQNGIIELAMVVVGAIGSAVAIWGRIKASKAIK
ncbi:MAG: hypothetical protein WA125_17455 [Desulfosporosinus sp.]